MAPLLDRKRNDCVFLTTSSATRIFDQPLRTVKVDFLENERYKCVIWIKIYCFVEKI